MHSKTVCFGTRQHFYLVVKHVQACHHMLGVVLRRKRGL